MEAAMELAEEDVSTLRRREMLFSVYFGCLLEGGSGFLSEQGKDGRGGRGATDEFDEFERRLEIEIEVESSRCWR